MLTFGIDTSNYTTSAAVYDSTAGAVVMEGVYYFLSGRLFAGMAFHTQGFKPAIALPLVALLFAFLAARAIFHDELLVRSADRIR